MIAESCDKLNDSTYSSGLHRGYADLLGVPHKPAVKRSARLLDGAEIFSDGRVKIMRIGLDVARLHLACIRLHGVTLLYSVPRIDNKCRLQIFKYLWSQTLRLSDH